MAATIRKLKPPRRSKMATELYESVGGVLDQMGCPPAGYVIVAWDKDGTPTASWNTPPGPVSMSLMPTFVHDVLQRRLTFYLSQD